MHAECTRFCCVTGEDAARGRGTDGCMDGSFSFLSFIFFLFVASARGPQSSLQSASISMALCVNAPPEARVKLSPAQTPAKPITASLDHRHGFSLQLLHSIHYAANSPSCSTLDSLFTPTFAPLICLLIPHAGLSCSFAHADTQSAMQLRQSVIRLSFMQDT